MELKEFEAKVTEHIGCYTNVSYADHCNYLQVLVIQDGKIVSIGEFSERFRSHCVGGSDFHGVNADYYGMLFANFSKQCEEYRMNQREKIPCISFIYQKPHLSDQRHTRYSY